MFRDFRLLHGTAEASPLTDVTQSMFVVVYGHFGLDTICLFYFLVFPFWGLLWWLPFLRHLSVIHFPSFTPVPHILAVFSFPLFSPLFPSISSLCIAILLHLSLVFPLSAPLFISTLFSTSPIHFVSLHCYTFAPFSSVSPSCTSFHFFLFPILLRYLQLLHPI